MVKTVLLEIHHLYYWPNFQPVIEELVSRKNYIIHVSTPFRNSGKQENIFRSLCSNFSIQFISSDNENNRIKKIIGNRYDVIIIGNVGQINKIAIKKSIVVMVYHGIGLKQSYYKDINNRLIFHIRFHLAEGMTFNFTNNKKNIILKTRLNNIWLFKSELELMVEDSILVDKNITKPTKQIVIKGIITGKKTIKKWSLEKI